MIAYKCRIESEIIGSCNEDFVYTQASLNSDGCIVIRNVYCGADDSTGKTDTIVVLSPRETLAILSLMRRFPKGDLPFESEAQP